MKLPNADKVVIPPTKIRDYLLSPTHPVGRHKAAFFARLGFVRGRWQELEAALRAHAVAHDVSRAEDSQFGKRYAVEGPITSPDGRNPGVRSVWFTETGSSVPVFVTAYPTGGMQDD
jgi:uncharacterized protein YbjT (DUF2867 family)